MQPGREGVVRRLVAHVGQEQAQVPVLVVADEFLLHEDRDRIRRLWDVCREMKQAFEKPSGTVASYEAKTTQLKRQFERLILGDYRPAKPAKKGN